jgi:hypothetical protein
MERNEGAERMANRPVSGRQCQSLILADLVFTNDVHDLVSANVHRTPTYRVGQQLFCPSKRNDGAGACCSGVDRLYSGLRSNGPS